MKSNNRQNPDASILGKIWTAQSILFLLTSEKQITDYLAKALISVPGINYCIICIGNNHSQEGTTKDKICEVCRNTREEEGYTAIPKVFECKLKNADDYFVFALKTLDHRFGFFVFSLDKSGLFDLYKPFICNLGNFIALCLENRLQKNDLQAARNILEQNVITRTNELHSANTDLKTEIDERRRAEEALQRERLLTDRVMETSPVGITVVSREGLITFANRQAEMMLGLTRNMITQRTYNAPEWRITDIDGDPFPEEDLPFRQVMKKRNPVYGVRHAIEWPDRRRICLSINGAPLLDDTGEIEKVIFTIENITDRIRYERAILESERKYREIFDNMLDGLYLLEVTDDGRFRTIEINPALEQSTGIPRDQVIGKTQEEAVSSVIAEIVNAKYRRCVEAGRPIEEEVELELPTGRRYFHSSLIPLADSSGRINRIIGISRDITKSKETEKSLVKLKNELEIRVQERTAELQVKSDELNENQKALMNIVEDLNEKSRELELANKELESFSYSVSHDMRAPLRAINGFCRILLREYLDNLDEKGKEYLQRIHSATLNMTQLIDALLSLSRVSRSEIHNLEVNLSEMVRDFCNILSESEPERKAVFIIKEDIKIMADPRLIKIAIENLLRNAWKFSSNKPSAQIEFGINEQNNRTVYFIRDNGAGFDMKYADKLFIAFQRLHSDTEFPGTGIGLATVQRIINKHGGKIWAEGDIDKGATFYFTIVNKSQ